MLELNKVFKARSKEMKFSLDRASFLCIHKLLEIGQHNDIFCE